MDKVIEAAVAALTQLANSAQGDAQVWRTQIELNTELVGWLRDLTARVEHLEAQ